MMFGLTGSAGPQNCLNVCGASVPLISRTMQGPEHSSVTMFCREVTNEIQLNVFNGTGGKPGTPCIEEQSLCTRGVCSAN